MKINNIPSADPKLVEVIDFIAQLSLGNYTPRTVGLESDALDHVVSGLNFLAEKLRQSTLPADCIQQVCHVIPMATFVLSPQGIIVSANPSIEKLIGFSRESMVGRSFVSFLCENERTPDILARLSRSPLCQTAISLKGASHSILNVEFSSCPVFDSESHIRFIFVTFSKSSPRFNVTGKFTALWSIFDALPDAISITNLAGKFIYMNEEFEKGTGWKESDIIGRTASELGFFTKDSFEKIQTTIIPTLMKVGSIKNTEITCYRRDGTEIPCLMSWAVMRGPTGEPSSVVVVTKNIAELRKVEEERTHMLSVLQELNDRYRILFDSSPNAYFVLDVQERIVDVNRLGEEMSGYHKRELLGQNFIELKLLASHTSREAGEEEGCFAGQPHLNPEESLLYRKDGSPIPVEVSDSSVNISGENHVLKIVKDISEQKRMQKVLVRSHEQLKQTTAQLIHRERLSALGELAANMSHELNQPLNSIKLITQSILRYFDNISREELHKDLSEVINHIQTMSEIISEMKRFSRVTIVEEKVEVSLNAIVENALKLMVFPLETLGIQLKTELPHELPSIRGDAIRLEQVVVNLVINARNALASIPNDRSKYILCRTYGRGKKAKGRGFSEAVLEVKDNGPGIPEELREKIFSPFFTTDTKGTGLGLSIVKKIIAEHKGSIELDDSDGPGAMFRMIFRSASND